MFRYRWGFKPNSYESHQIKILVGDLNPWRARVVEIDAKLSKLTCLID